MFDIFRKISQALTKTTGIFGKKLRSLFSKPLDQNTLEELEQILYEGDLGSSVIEDLLSSVKVYYREHPDTQSIELLRVLEKKAMEILCAPPAITSVRTQTYLPHVILIVGINGSGKTTSVAKLAAYHLAQNKRVLIAAGDTFRAAASEQLALWCQKLAIDLVKGSHGADPSSVIFDALQSARAKQTDVVIADTAGRLESKEDLMKELDKIHRVIKKFHTEAPHEVYLVIDATMGQNVVQQALIFNKYTPITGIILTKLDGSAKGGVILRLYREMGIPIKWIGTGESVEDFIPFDAERYVTALFAS